MSFVPGGRGMEFALEVRAEQLRRKREQRAREAGENLANSVADVSVVPDVQWERDLRAFNPITDKVSHLRFYWYRAGMRWVLYDCLPLSLIPNDDTKMNPTTTGAELLRALRGVPPRELPDAQDSPVSDVQHEMARRFGCTRAPSGCCKGITVGIRSGSLRGSRTC
jgi:hypothetical protein